MSLRPLAPEYGQCPQVVDKFTYLGSTLTVQSSAQ